MNPKKSEKSEISQKSLKNLKNFTHFFWIDLRLGLRDDEGRVNAVHVRRWTQWKCENTPDA